MTQLAELFIAPRGTQWQLLAACADTDPDLWTEADRAEEAATICTRCPVRSACLDYALEHDERFGIWGGLNVRERERLQASRRR